MSVFDPDFETLRLSMLAEQYADQLQEAGEILFKAEQDENYVSHARWFVGEQERFQAMSDSGFKLHLMGLLDNLVEYRIQFNQPPMREGKVQITAGQLLIEWLPDGSTELSE